MGTSRQTLKALYPHWDNMLMQNNLKRLNNENTRFMPGHKPSLLDIFYSNTTEKIDGIETKPNILSEHSLVKLNLHTNLPRKKSQFKVIRKYYDVVFSRLQDILDKNQDLNKMFTDDNIDNIAEIINGSMNSAVKSLMTKKLIQMKRNLTPFWDRELDDERKTVDELKRISDTSNRVEDYRFFKNMKNRHIRNMKKKKKTYYNKLYSNKRRCWKELKNNE